MNAISEYLDRAKEVTGSDYKTAKAIGVTRQQISTARSKGHLGPDPLGMLAELLKISPFEIVAEIYKERTENPEMKNYWGKKGKEISRGLITGFLGFFALAPLLPDLIARGLYIVLTRRPTPAA